MKKLFANILKSFKSIDYTKKKNYLLVAVISVLVASNCYFIYLLNFSESNQQQAPSRPAVYTGLPGPMSECATYDDGKSSEPETLYKYDPSTVLLNEDPFISSKSLSFETGEAYSVCGRYGEVPMYDTIDGPIHEMLNFCADVEASLLGSSIPKGKLFIINDGWAVFEIESGPDVDDKIKPARIKFLKIEDISTPFVLTDGKNSIPLKYAGVTKVIVKPTGYQVEGSDDPCHGAIEPSIDRESESRSLTPFDKNFAHDKSILLQNTSNEITKHCGT